MAELVYRHNPVTRVTHWLNAVALVVLVMSGLQIFNAHPYLYWGSSSEPEEAFLAIAATNDDGDTRGFVRILQWQFDTTGVLGVQNTNMGPAARAFPSWLTIPGYFWLAGGRRWHFFFGWVFAITGFVYIVFNGFNRHVGKFILTARDLKKLPSMVLYYLHFRRQSPQEGEYNPLQKLAYTSVFFILTPLMVLTGLAMSPQMNTAFHWLPEVFGGRQSARSIHFLLTFAFVLFTVGHVFMVITTGLFNNMRSMVTGWYEEKLVAQPSTAVQEIIEPTTIAPSVVCEEQPPATVASVESPPEGTPANRSENPTIPESAHAATEESVKREKPDV
jgi:Ni/Fe-hydrogenase b-type cytochrome subunit